MLEKIVPLLQKPGIIDPLLKLVRSANARLDLNKVRYRGGKARMSQLLAARERRVMDAITLRREPDRVPVIGGGVNFFPAKHAGISVADFMFDPAKMRRAYFKTCMDFPLDTSFPSFLLAIGRVATAAKLSVLKIPGRDIDANSSYQYNEVDRLRDDEWESIARGGVPFVVGTILPRMVELLAEHGAARLAGETRVALELARFLATSMGIMGEMEGQGIYNFLGGFAFPPFDVMSLVFRTLPSLTRDLMRKQTREHVVQLCERMNPWLIRIYLTIAKATGLPGVFFPSERAFSLSPRQFEQYYWPTLKQMIVALVDAGLIPFLEWEADTTHLVPFLKEIPRRISRRCVFNCDASDILEVHKILDGHMAITGNIPLSTMCIGTPHDVEKYCAKLFEALKPGGGYMLCPALGIPDEARPENVHAMIRYAWEHGRY
nr:uroporphyrinogen decarboxylase family protein [Candidatus Sigynarchaeum springense]